MWPTAASNSTTASPLAASTGTIHARFMWSYAIAFTIKESIRWNHRLSSEMIKDKYDFRHSTKTLSFRPERSDSERGGGTLFFLHRITQSSPLVPPASCITLFLNPDHFLGSLQSRKIS